MADSKLASATSACAPKQQHKGLSRVFHDASLQGSGTKQDPLGFAVAISAQIRITATVANDLSITYTADVLNLTGGITFGGLDAVVAPGYLKVILTLTAPIPVPDVDKLPIPGIHLPQLPPGPVGETVFLYVPPIPLQTGSSDASMLVPIFGKGIANTQEIIDVTYQLVLVSIVR